MKILKKKVEVKEVTKKETLKKLLSERVYKIFDQEPRGSVQGPDLDKLADDILAL